jgi:hypothetical protein
LAGGYSAADALNESRLSAVVSTIHARVNRKNSTLVAGYFNETLNAGLLERARQFGHPFQPALYVDVDVDIYPSAYQCMDWMLANNLIVPTSIIRYDDWPAPGDNVGANYGEARAHHEITQKYGIRWEQLHGYGRTSKYTFQVLSIGVP